MGSGKSKLSSPGHSVRKYGMKFQIAGPLLSDQLHLAGEGMEIICDFFVSYKQTKDGDEINYLLRMDKIDFSPVFSFRREQMTRRADLSTFLSTSRVAQTIKFKLNVN